jgi:hypothetical protein
VPVLATSNDVLLSLLERDHSAGPGGGLQPSFTSVEPEKTSVLSGLEEQALSDTAACLMKSFEAALPFPLAAAVAAFCFTVAAAATDKTYTGETLPSSVPPALRCRNSKAPPGHT